MALKTSVFGENELLWGKTGLIGLLSDSFLFIGCMHCVCIGGWRQSSVEGVLMVVLQGPGERCPFSRRSSCGLVEGRMRVGFCVTSVRAPRIQKRMSVRSPEQCWEVEYRRWILVSYKSVTSISTDPASI